MRIFAFILLLSSLILSGQNNTKKKSSKPRKITCYLPSGDKCPEEKVGINMLETNKNFAQKGTTWFTYPTKEFSKYKCFVVLKSFTKIPLYITPIDHDDYTKDDIILIMNNLDYSYYFGSTNIGFKSDLKELIDNKKLTDILLIERLGHPSQSKESYQNGRYLKYMDYDQYKIRIWLINGYAYSYDEL